MNEANRQAPNQKESLPESGLRVFESRTLFGDQREVLIRHAGQHYRLRITAQDKLILTK